MSTQPSSVHLLQPRPYPRLLSMVIPMFNEEQVVPFLRAALVGFMGELKCDVEVILVNDGSTDNTLALIADWARTDARIKIVHLSRNFGHQSACTAGLDYAVGDAVVLIDADLQDPPPVIHDMLIRYCQGYDVVYGQREERAGETVFKKTSAWLFYRFMRRFVHEHLPPDVGDFRLLSRHCLNGLRQMRETHRFLRGMIAWVGYPQIGVRYQRAPRIAGETKYPLRRMLQFAWTAATSFSVLPLKAATGLGMLALLFGVEEAIRAVLAHVLGWYAVPGWTTLMVALCVIGGALLISIGVLGEYVGKIYEQSKQRPLYVVARTFNLEAASISNTASTFRVASRP